MSSETTPLTNPTVDVMMSHASVRRFTADLDREEMIDAVLAAARRAPTSSNWQTYSIIVVRDPHIKARLAVLAGGQDHVVSSQVFFVFCADLHRLEFATQRHGVDLVLGLQDTIVSAVDAAIVGEAAQIAAESFGLGAVMVGALRRNTIEVAKTLDLPDGVAPVFGMSVGWPAEDPRSLELKPRLPEPLVIHRDTYSDEGAAELVDEYNEQLARHYDAQGHNIDPDAAWTGPIANRASEHRYPNLRTDLETLGFKFD